MTVTGEVLEALREGGELTPSEVVARWGGTVKTARAMFGILAARDSQIRRRRVDYQGAFTGGPPEVSWFRLPDGVDQPVTT